ncbi:MAG TPA: hypothetical protein DCQ93_07105 [Bacteroidetes bacterium]|nr:hypothetical protein [Bacteroidota bacterium]
MKKILLLLFVLFSISASASHIAGGNLYYSWISGNDYKLTLELYRDCSGISAPTSVTITADGALSSSTVSTTLNLVGSGEEVMLLCPGSISLSTCSGGTYPGYQKYTYTGTITLSVNDQWTMYYEDCCRNGAITNISGASGYGILIDAFLDNTVSPVNNSSVFSNSPIMVMYANQFYQISNSAIDPDGDSLSFSFRPPLDWNGGDSIPFAIPYSSVNPFSSSTTISMDHATGTISATPSAIQTFVMCVSVSEFRNGLLVGKTNRDLQYLVINGANQIPTLSGINGTSSFYISTCPGTPLSFYIDSSDPNSGDSVTIEMDSTLQNSSLTSSGGNFQTATINWTPTMADVSATPHLFTLTARDNYCPFAGVQTFTYEIYVTPCNSDSVWPGDVNYDLISDLYDMLSLGLAYGDTGAARIGATTNWSAQYCANWSGSFVSGINHKHADCDGNGVVDSSDISVINSNTGLTHFKLEEGDNSFDRSIPTLSIQIAADTVQSGSQLNGSVYLDDSGNDLQNIYGVALKVSASQNVIDSSTFISSANGWLDNSTGIINWNKSSASEFDLVFVRKNHIGVDGHGLIGNFSFMVPWGSMGVADFTITEAKIISASENEVQVNHVGDNAFILLIDGTNEIGEPILNLFPNPVSNILNVKADQPVSRIKITDACGRILFVSEKTLSNFSINTENFESGVYLIEATANGSTSRKTFVKL